MLKYVLNHIYDKALTLQIYKKNSTLARMLLINLKTPKGWLLVFFRLERKSNKGTLMKFTLLQLLFNKNTKKAELNPLSYEKDFKKYSQYLPIGF